MSTLPVPLYVINCIWLVLSQTLIIITALCPFLRMKQFYTKDTWSIFQEYIPLYAYCVVIITTGLANVGHAAHAVIQSHIRPHQRVGSCISIHRYPTLLHAADCVRSLLGNQED